MSNYLKYASIIAALTILPAEAQADASLVSFKAWESACRPSAKVSDLQAKICFSNAVDLYYYKFLPVVFDVDRMGDINCEDV